jgi:RNA polymerase-binding transcription factor DksA
MAKQTFDKKFLEEQKKALLIEKERLEAELSKRGTEKKDDSGDYTATYQDFGTDEESNAAEYAQTETNVSVLGQLEASLGDVHAALERIEKDSYGLDVNTGEPISKKRLQANPAASTAISHAKE